MPRIALESIPLALPTEVEKSIKALKYYTALKMVQGVEQMWVDKIISLSKRSVIKID